MEQQPYESPRSEEGSHEPPDRENWDRRNSSLRASPAGPPVHIPGPDDSGFYYRSGRPIPPTHPDHGPMHLLPRQEDGSFAAYYYCSKEELDAGPIEAPPPRRRRRDGFSPERQQQFVEHLRDTASFTDAARLTGISRTTAYNLYNSPDAAAFHAAVDEALKATDFLLETTAIDRAVNGQEEIVYYQGQRVGVRVKYDNRLLMSLLRARNPLKYAPLHELEGWLKRRGIEPPADVECALDRLGAAEAEWGRRLPGETPPAGPALAPPAADDGLSSLAPPSSEPVPLPSRPNAEAEPAQASSSSTSGAGQAAQASSSSTLPPGTPAPPEPT